MDDLLTAGKLFASHQGKLCLTWVAGKAGKDRELRKILTTHDRDHDRDHDLGALVGHMNLSHPNRIQVLGRDELAYLDGLGKNSHQDAVAQLFSDQPAFVVITGAAQVPDELIQLAENSATALFSSSLHGHKLITHLQYYLANLLAERITLHGVFMDVMSIGVLIAGDSCMGKSELAFELLSRGHRLIADDAPEFSHVGPGTINGTCPPVLDGFLEVRGLGVLNVRAMFGDSVIKRNKHLRLIIRLEEMRDEAIWEADRLRGSFKLCRVLEVDIPEITLPVAPGRNLAVLVEGAVLNHIQHLKGYDAAQDFIDRQARIMQDNQS